MAILTASKLVHHEAVEILYGMRKFMLPTLTALRMFLTTIGEGRVHLERLRVFRGYHRTAAKATLDLLADAKALRQLTLSFAPEQQEIDAGRVATDCADWLEALRHRHETHHSEGEILDVLRIEWKCYHMYGVRCGSGCIVQQKALDFRKEVRRLLETRFQT